jgi:RHH-type proline utilization regulon transcriptional repressor/proline dehydrogenase/delta 1-pyrroline-5-carboxylate dehydrogenase
VEGVDAAVARAGAAAPRWAATPPAARRRLLHAVAAVMAQQRDEAIATMVHDAAKTVGEADPEVSEAIDFARYYGDAALGLPDDGTFRPYGTVVVASPWNFPYAIPAGGVLGSLAAGNTVILKPAPETVETAALLARQCWQAGVPRDVLQFEPAADDDAGRRLITHPDVGAVVLTGSWDTARMFLGWRPDLALHAETSGKNAIVITAAADLDDAIRDLVRSAFGHAGQKCSAASLAIVEASVYDRGPFLRRLAEDVRTLRVGPATELSTEVSPLIRPPEGPLADALTTLGPGEEWLVPPLQLDHDRRLWRPGVKVGVRPGSPFHLTECFGPVLGVMRADDLDHAIELQNGVPFGLTGGLHSLDPEEVARWLERVEVGNAYVNRHITGAIVRRQPFGGWKRSVVGPGAKAGGPCYVASLGRWGGSYASPEDVAAEAARRWPPLLAGVDESGLRAEENTWRLRPLRRVVLRIGEDVDRRDVDVAMAVARALGVPTEVSARAAGAIDGTTIEADDAFLRRLPSWGLDKVRLLGRHGPGVRLGVLDAGVWLDDRPVVHDGAIEVMRWGREQAVSRTRHRHGNVRPETSISG